MKKSALACAVAATLLSGCATMGSPELVECLQPNRRVVVEIGGTKVKPPPKPKPGAKPGKPGIEVAALRALAQGNSAWDPGSAVLKDSGKGDLDKLVGILSKGAGKDTRPTTVGSIIIVGHTDRLEVADGKKDLDEERARRSRDYLVSKGLDAKLMFWEGKDDKEPVRTKFCQD
jgi:OOP family OmpA-OmpF porin